MPGARNTGARGVFMPGLLSMLFVIRQRQGRSGGGCPGVPENARSLLHCPGRLCRGHGTLACAPRMLLAVEAQPLRGNARLIRRTAGWLLAMRPGTQEVGAACVL